MARATRSFPLPDGPVIKTDVPPGATRHTRLRTVAITGLSPSSIVSTVAAPSRADVILAVISGPAPKMVKVPNRGI
jgi:hypothetical protein